MRSKQHRFDVDLTYSETTGSWQVDNLNRVLFVMKILSIVNYDLYTDDYDYHVVWVEL